MPPAPSCSPRPAFRVRFLLCLALWTAPVIGARPEAVPGAEDHWAFRPLVAPDIPRGDGTTRARNPIDRFIAERVRQAGLRPAPEADRRTLYRRVHFDLVGLPPDPDAMDAFVADPDPLAYERLVDRLLASPGYGERWARHWLDVVHYGETHGYDKDKPRPNAWPYRDYVVRAFNTDKPYARFVQEQIAGDVLAPDTEDGNTALGFIAAGPWDFIGHAEVPESKEDGRIARMLDRDDMVASVMNTFCSLTVQCARCHDHKFDPVPQIDYYRLTAVFSALDRADRAYDPDPVLAATRRALEGKLRALEDDRRHAEESLRAQGGPALALLDRLREELGRKPLPEHPEFGWHSAVAPSADSPRWVQVDLGTPVLLDRVVLAPCHDDFNGIGAGFGFPRRYRVEVSDDPGFESGVTVLADRTAADQDNPGTVPVMVPAKGVRARHIRVTATRLAPRSGDFIFALAELGALDADGRNHALGASVSASDSIEAPPRWAASNLTDGYGPGHAFARATMPGDTGRAWRASLLSGLDSSLVRKAEETAVAVRDIREQLGALPPRRIVYAGTIHHGSGAFRGTGPDGGLPRPIHVLARGDIRKPREEVGPGTVAFVTGTGRFEIPPTASESDRRLALAEWLADPGNPLTWRSIVNRVWQYHFGSGLVDTANDFGRMGAAPSHPELLDWLAATFRDGPQSIKALHRLILTSATYRQATRGGDPRGAAIDADNRLLWRQNRRKLEAEAVRDSLLSVAGHLDRRMGGASFQDFVIEKPEHSPHYEYGLADPEDPAAARRSVYRWIVRSHPHPFLTTLDCADPSMSVERRNESLSPLQALALLNNRLSISMAGRFARQIEATVAAPESRPASAFRRAVGRQPNREELELLVSVHRDHGLAAVCRLIFNLNEFLFID